jgi:hypothetical protein
MAAPSGALPAKGPSTLPRARKRFTLCMLVMAALRGQNRHPHHPHSWNMAGSHSSLPKRPPQLCILAAKASSAVQGNPSHSAWLGCARYGAWERCLDTSEGHCQGSLSWREACSGARTGCAGRAPRAAAPGCAAQCPAAGPAAARPPRPAARSACRCTGSTSTPCRPPSSP